jgi:hypothetical protein
LLFSEYRGIIKIFQNLRGGIVVTFITIRGNKEEGGKNVPVAKADQA